MEIFLITVVLSLQVVCLCLQIYHFRKLGNQIEKISETQSRIPTVLTDFKEEVISLTNKTDAIANNLDRHLLALREALEPTKPIRPNNWDSVREAFKGPTRVEINERN
jgi:hypothetical protein